MIERRMAYIKSSGCATGSDPQRYDQSNHRPLIDDEMDVGRQARLARTSTRYGAEQGSKDNYFDDHENDHDQEQREADPGRNVSH